MEVGAAQVFVKSDGAAYVEALPAYIPFNTCTSLHAAFHSAIC